MDSQHGAPDVAGAGIFHFQRAGVVRGAEQHGLLLESDAFFPRGQHPFADMVRLLGIEPGSVTPLAMINAAPGSVTAALDLGLAEAPRINVHPLRNTGTLGLGGGDVLRLLEHWGHKPVVAQVPVVDGENNT